MVDRDRYGHCVSCHKYLLREVIDRGKVVLAPTVDSTDEIFLLDDNSQMRVVICVECKKSLEEDKFQEIMDSVVKGWDWETDQLEADPKKDNWTKEDKDKYMERHRKLGIVTRPEGLSKQEVEKRVKKFKEDKVKKAKK